MKKGSGVFGSLALAGKTGATTAALLASLLLLPLSKFGFNQRPSVVLFLIGFPISAD